MKKLLELGNQYAKKSDWKDFALVKLCLCSMGMIIGTLIPNRHKNPSRIISGCVFGITYGLLMSKMIRIVKDMMR